MRRSALLATLSCVLLSVTVQGAAKEPPAGNEDGLVQIGVAGLDRVFARPGADLSRYSKLLLDPIEVSFRKDWGNVAVAGSRITTQQKLDIRQGLAKVLRVKAEINDHFINAPDEWRTFS